MTAQSQFLLWLVSGLSTLGYLSIATIAILWAMLVIRRRRRIGLIVLTGGIAQLVGLVGGLVGQFAIASFLSAGDSLSYFAFLQLFTTALGLLGISCFLYAALSRPSAQPENSSGVPPRMDSAAGTTAPNPYQSPI